MERPRLSLVEIVGLSVLGIAIGVVSGLALAALGIGAFNWYHPAPASAGEIAVSRGASIYFIVMSAVFAALGARRTIGPSNRPAIRVIACAVCFTLFAVFCACSVLFGSNLSDPRY